MNIDRSSRLERDSESNGSSVGPFAARAMGLSQRYRNKDVLSGINLDVPRGCVLGLLGLNGAGKTTLLRHFLGLQLPASGRIEVLGGDPSRDRERVMQAVGYMSEEDSLPKWMRVRDVIRFCSRVYKTWEEAESLQRASAYGLDLDQPLSKLSKGQRARVALLAAIGHRPELLILDEPGSGLDPIARDDILEAIVRSSGEEGRTVILSSHQLEDVNRAADRIAILADQRIAMDLAVNEIPERFSQCLLAGPEQMEPKPEWFVDSVIDCRKRGPEWSVLIEHRSGRSDPPTTGVPDGWHLVDSQAASLKRVFEAFAATKKETADSKGEAT
ncbi:MAG: ABC transporter ATP-binding protein [Planctomycetota bacterium]